MIFITAPWSAMLKKLTNVLFLFSIDMTEPDLLLIPLVIIIKGMVTFWDEWLIFTPSGNPMSKD